MILESKLSVLSDVDKPVSPAGEAFKDYRLMSEDKTQKMREEYRKIFSVLQRRFSRSSKFFKT